MTTTGEQNLAARLTHPEKSERDAGFSLMERWVTALGSPAAAASPEEMLKLWKALFYCVWMSDKPLVQQELIVRMSSLVGRLAGAAAGPKQHPRVAAFVGAFFATMQREWLGLDRNRVDKYMSLIRRMVYEALRYAGAPATPAPAQAAMLAVLQAALCTAPGGVAMQVAAVYTAELAASGCASGPKATPARLQRLLSPLLAALPALGKDRALLANLHNEALKDGLLAALAAAKGGQEGQQAEEEEEEEAAASAKPMTGLPPEQRVDPHAAELAFLLEDRRCRARAAVGAYAQASCAGLAREFFAIGAAASTAGAAREVAYDMHKGLAELAVACGEVASMKDTYPALPAFEAGVARGEGEEEEAGEAGGAAGKKPKASKSKGGVKPWEREAAEKAGRKESGRGRREEEGEEEEMDEEEEDDEEEDDEEEDDEEEEEEEEQQYRPTPKGGLKRRIAPPQRANPPGFKKASRMVGSGKKAAAAAEPAEGRGGGGGGGGASKAVRFSESAVKRKEGKRPDLGMMSRFSGGGGGGGGKKGGRGPKGKAGGGNPRKWGAKKASK